jgi:hypothetical protein
MAPAVGDISYQKRTSLINNLHLLMTATYAQTRKYVQNVSFEKSAPIFSRTAMWGGLFVGCGHDRLTFQSGKLGRHAEAAAFGFQADDRMSQ